MQNLDLPGIAFRVSIMYVYTLTLLRLSGKQSVSHLTALDFIVTLIIGDLFDDVFWVEVPILQGMVAFAAITLVHFLVTYATSRNRFIHQFICSSPRLVIQNGKLLQENLRRERMSPETIQFELRLNGEEHPRDVKEARLEPKGKVSVLKAPLRKPIKKKDLHLLG